MSERLQDFKREYFERDNPGSEFPELRVLPEQERAQIVRDLTVKHFPDIDSLDDYGDALRNILSLAHGGFQEHHDIPPGLKHTPFWTDEQETCLIGLDGFDTLEEIESEFLKSAFDWVWYPGADDLFIIAADASWLILVDYAGAIWYPRFSDL